MSALLNDTLNSEQTKALVAIKDWLAETNNKVFSLAGAFYTGKSKVLKFAVHEFVRNGKTLLYLAPNASIADRYKDRGFSDVSSIYSWLYAGSHIIRNGKKVYPVDHRPIDPDKVVIVVFDSHLLGNEFCAFAMDTTVYGSGYILSDFLSSLTGSDSNAPDAQASLELTALPKIFLLGDPYQLTRGARDKSLLGCQIFEQRKVSFIRTELKSQDRDDLAPIEMLDFQNPLIGQIKDMKFVQLPLCQQGSIKTIAKGEHTDSIVSSLTKWPRRTAYLCSTNDHAQNVNDGIRKNYLGAHSLGLLTKGDIVDIRNRTLNLQVNEYEQTEVEWVSSGQFARVVSSDARIETKSIPLKGRKNPTSVDLARASIECSGGNAEILYLTDFLSASTPELTQDQNIALQVWAREEAIKTLAPEKKELDEILKSTNKEDDRYKEKLREYNKRLNHLIMRSRYTNAARLRYAYALTVHRAQNYEPLPSVVLDGSCAHDTDNPATDSYFRWLYTATTCTSDSLQILNYPELTPLSKAEWSFGPVRLVPIIPKHTLYYPQDRIPTDAELAVPLPSGFSNPEPRLLSLLLTVYELINDTDWRVESITQHNYKERYFFTSDRGEVTVELNYNDKYEVSVGKVQLDSGHQDLSSEIKNLLVTDPIFRDENIATAVSIFRDHLARKNWAVVSLDEKNYKVFLIAEHTAGKIKTELNVPSDSSISKKGMISSVKVQQADSKVVADQFEADFANG